MSPCIHCAWHRANRSCHSQLWFVSFYGALGFILPYFNLLLQHYGYSGWQLGVISALRPFVSACCNPLWAALADKHQIHRQVFLLALAVTVAVRPRSPTPCVSI